MRIGDLVSIPANRNRMGTVKAVKGRYALVVWPDRTRPARHNAQYLRVEATAEELVRALWDVRPEMEAS